MIIQNLLHHTRGLLLLALSLPCALQAEHPQRTELFFPDLPGYVTLRCDFHMHTVFSDGDVWPTVRVQEAWRDGLDAIALTDHIEYQRYKQDIPIHYGRSAEVAGDEAKSLGILVIRAAEITRGEPPGHLNTLFLTNVAALNQKEYRAALSNAFDQSAFIFWNHPGWKQPNHKSVWYAEQGEFYTNGWLQGIEIVNGPNYDPIAHQWCLDKKLTLVAGSDLHSPAGFEFRGPPDNLRPVTLVFAKERSLDGIHEALRARRTAVVSGGRLFGDAEYLEALFRGSVEVLKPEPRLRAKGRGFVQVRNKSPLRFELRLNSKLPELDVEDRVLLEAGKVTAIQVRCVSNAAAGTREVLLPCKVTNFMLTPTQTLATTLPIQVTFE
jgi:3',5'-nucleoside bisphosphate phosphatase